MYTDIKSVQIVIALLKKYNIKNIVISAGTRHTPFVRSVESDSFFNCFSVVDERSASFFALGLIKELKEPVVIACTSGTAVSNYTSAVSEAFYAKLPLVVVTADRNGYYLNQQEEQMVPQQNIFKEICKKEVVLPFVNNSKDFWYCNRLVNEALLDIECCNDGPVHIDIPIEDGLFDFATEVLPETIKIEKIYLNDCLEKWSRYAEKLNKAKRILITYGQADKLSNEEEVIVEKFAKKFGAVIAVDHLSNLKCYGTVNAYTFTRVGYAKLINELVPDIVIAMNGNAVETRGWLVNCSGQYEFWNVLKSGEISDPLRCLNTTFACSTIDFFKKMLDCAPVEDGDPEYYELWMKYTTDTTIPELEYSDVYAVQKFMEKIPQNAILNLANSNSVRISQYFDLDREVKVFCNRGTSGIDGSMSTFVGQSCVHDGLSFLLIGDLSYFYDMNALWNRYIGNNIRIMMNNNGCGEIFYRNDRQDAKTVGMHIAADHMTSAKEWVEARGFYYIKANNKEEFDQNIQIFFDESINKPIFFEVFTDKKKNIEQDKKVINANKEHDFISSVKGIVKKFVGDK